MEVLNRNQRRSAMWRLAAVLGIIVAMVTVVLWAMGTTMSGGDDNRVQELRDSLSLVKDQYDGRVLGLENKIVQLEKDLADAAGDDSAALIIEEQKLEIKGLEKELDACKVDLRVAKAMEKLR